MGNIDLSQIISPEDVRILCTSGHRGTGEFSEAISRGVREYWDNISEERYKYRCEVNSRRFTAEERLKSSERSEAQWLGYSKERREEELAKVFLNEGYREVFAEKRRNMTPEETEEWISRSFNNPQARKLAVKNMRIGLKNWWAGLSEEEKEKEITKRVSASRKANACRPSEPERYLDNYLQKKYPNEWAYNGGMEQGVLIGNKIPDFVNINGKKEVIEVFGIYWHSPEEVEEKKAHYKKYGFDCKVIWEFECYDSEEVERILS